MGFLNPLLRYKYHVNHCLAVVVLFPVVGVRLQCAEVEESGEKVEEDLAYSGRAHNLRQGDVVEALEILDFSVTQNQKWTILFE